MDITINGTVVSLPDSAASPNWAPAILQAFTLIETALAGLSGSFDVSPQVLDISAFNTATDENVTGLSFSTSNVRSAVITYYVYRTTNSTNASESGQIFIDYNASRSSNEKWSISREAIGDGSITFGITDAGQVTFTTTALSGASHEGYIGFFAKTLEQEE
jgi:hypothetical protein